MSSRSLLFTSSSCPSVDAVLVPLPPPPGTRATGPVSPTPMDLPSFFMYGKEEEIFYPGWGISHCKR